MRLLASVATAVAAALLSLPVLGDEWPRFRGPQGNGFSPLKGVPATWTESDFEWKVELPGVGHSSPVVWGKRLFLTTGTEDGDRSMRCLDAITGKELWSDTVKLGANPLHKKNSYASGTPTADEERVYVGHADTGRYVVVAYTHDGEKVWSEDLGPFVGQHGQGMSLLVFKDLLIVPNDQDGPSSIVALNRKTGKRVWANDRPSREVSYSTPFVFDKGPKPQLICVSGVTGMTGLDLDSGKTLWSSAPMDKRTVGSPVEAGGFVFVTCGSGGRGSLMLGINPLAPDSNPIGLTKGMPYVPTPVAKGDLLFLWTDDGFVACLDVASRQELWRKRVSGNYSASPILIDDKIYGVGEDGQVAVVAASREYELFGKSPIGDNSFSTPAVANGRVYFRGFHTLASLKAK